MRREGYICNIDHIEYTLRREGGKDLSESEGGLYAQPEGTEQNGPEVTRVCRGDLAMKLLDNFFDGKDSLAQYLLRTDQDIPAWLMEHTRKAAEARQ